MTQGAARVILRIVGGLSVLLALGGLLYTTSTTYGFILSGAVDDVAAQHDTPYVRTAFYVMASICTAFYLALLLFGVRLLFLKTRLLWLFTTILIVEVLYFLSIGFFWPHPTYGLSIAAASGVANGGLVLQFFLLFPLWAPFAVYFARRSEQRVQDAPA